MIYQYESEIFEKATAAVVIIVGIAVVVIVVDVATAFFLPRSYIKNREHEIKANSDKKKQAKREETIRQTKKTLDSITQCTGAYRSIATQSSLHQIKRKKERKINCPLFGGFFGNYRGHFESRPMNQLHSNFSSKYDDVCAHAYAHIKCVIKSEV